MLDKSLHKHLDLMDEIEADIDNEIAKIYAALDIDEIINDPQAEMLEAVKAVEKIINDKFVKRAVDAGLDLAKVVKDHIAKDKDIKIQRSNDPKLNQELKNDNSDS